MTLPSSGTLRFSDIQAEFSEYGTANNLRAYLRGGDYVPDIPANSGIPTSGPLRVRDFLGASVGLPISADSSPAANRTGPAGGPYNWNTNTVTYTVTGAVTWSLAFESGLTATSITVSETATEIQLRWTRGSTNGLAGVSYWQLSATQGGVLVGKRRIAVGFLGPA